MSGNLNSGLAYLGVASALSSLWDISLKSPLQFENVFQKKDLIWFDK